MLGILRAGHMPVALENFTPETDSKRAVISDALASSQFYVIILGSRYGSIPEDQQRLPTELRDKSYTEIELDMALAAKLPILAFFMDSDEVTKGRLTPVDGVRIAKLIADLPGDHPARREGEREIARLEALGLHGETRGTGPQDGQRPLPSLSA